MAEGEPSIKKARTSAEEEESECTCNLESVRKVLLKKEHMSMHKSDMLGFCAILKNILACKTHSKPAHHEALVLITDAYFKPVLSLVYELPVCMGATPVHWPMWLKPVCVAMQRYFSRGSEALDGYWFMWFMLFDCCARNLSEKDYYGNFELQLLVHQAIYNNMCAIVTNRHREFIRGIEFLRDEFGTNADYGKICGEAIRRIGNYHTPVVGTALYWTSGERFALTKSAYSEQ